MRPSIRRLIQIINAWCPTGKGQGRDNSCSPREPGKGGGQPDLSRKAKRFMNHLPRSHVTGLRISVVPPHEMWGRGQAEYLRGRGVKLSEDLLNTQFFHDWYEASAYEDSHRGVRARSVSARDYDLPISGNITKDYVRSVLTHEVGHRVYEEILSDSQRKKAESLFSKIDTPTITSYRDYVQERSEEYAARGVSRDPWILTSKLAREQFAEAYRQWQLDGKHKALFKKLGLKG